MTRKNTLTSLDSHRQYAVIGLDLAKYDVSVAAIPVDDLSPALVDRMVYSDLMELASIVSPTLFVMEPCNGYILNFKLWDTKQKSSAARPFPCGSTPTCPVKKPISMTL